MRSEADAKTWVRARVPRETFGRLALLARLVGEESERQNLVSAATRDQIWLRHIADSAQLVDHCTSPETSWLDLGTGAGFPGLVVAALHRGPVTLVEERRLRVQFLRHAADAMGLAVEILGNSIERVPPRPFGVISARAFAPLPRLLEAGTGFSTTNTLWLLPKGKNAVVELEALDPSWQGDFRLEPSLTDAQAKIIVAKGVHRKAKRKPG